MSKKNELDDGYVNEMYRRKTRIQNRNSERVHKYAEMEKARLKKFIFLFIIPLTIILLAGMTLLIIGTKNSLETITTIGYIFTGIGIIPIIIWGIIELYLK